MINTRDVNIQMITTVARRLGNLREKVVFVGGCATGLFITDPAMPEVRMTKDVDVIIDITTRMEYYKLEADLRSPHSHRTMVRSSCSRTNFGR